MPQNNKKANVIFICYTIFNLTEGGREMSDHEMSDIHDQIQKLKRERQPLDLDAAIKNNEIIKTLTAVCLKMDDKEHREGILKVINQLTTDNMHNLDHIPNEHWYQKS